MIDINIKKYGSGERHFVGFHGWGAAHQKSFSDLLEHLPDDVTFYGVDLPGCGGSEALDAWTWRGVQDALISALDEYVLEPVTLVGSCSGSFHALDWAMHRAHFTKRLVLLEPFAYIPWFFSIFVKPVVGKVLYHTVFDNPVGRHMTQRQMRQQGVSQDYDMVGSFARGSDLNVAYEYLRLYSELDHFSIFSPIQAPVHIITGEKSWASIHESVEMWRTIWPELTHHEVAGVGHMLSHVRSEEVAGQIFGP